MKAGPGRPKGPARRRVQVTLPLETWEMIEGIAERLDQPKATLMAELIGQALPALDLTIQALDLAEEAPREAQRLVTNYGEEQVRRLKELEQGGANRGRTT